MGHERSESAGEWRIVLHKSGQQQQQLLHGVEKSPTPTTQSFKQDQKEFKASKAIIEKGSEFKANKANIQTASERV